MLKIITVTGIGYATAMVGLLLGAFCSVLLKDIKKSLYGTMMGFTAGLLIAFVCFEMLPVSFDTAGVYAGIAGITAGVLTACYMEGKVNRLHMMKAGALLALAVGLHNIPEGMALGSLLAISFGKGLSMALIIAIHCFPEAIAIFMPMKQAGLSCSKLFIYCFLLALPMAVGAFVGGALCKGNTPTTFVALILSFAGGVILYTSCGEIIPESKSIYAGRLSTLGAMAGFVIGIFLIYLL